MKQITINVKDERMEQLLKLLKENNFDWISDSTEEFEIPQWQIDEVERRSAEAERHPELLIPWEEVKSHLGQKFK